MPKLGKKLVKNMVAPRAPRALLGSGLNDDSGRAVSREYRGKKKVAAALLRDSSLDDMVSPPQRQLLARTSGRTGIDATVYGQWISNVRAVPHATSVSWVTNVFTSRL